MAHYINKDVLVVEIEKWISGWTERLNNTNPSNPSFFEGGIAVGKHVLSFLNSLEVKEVDYDKEVTEYLKNFENANIGHRLSLRRCAKHFFELGLKVQHDNWNKLNNMIC